MIITRVSQITGKIHVLDIPVTEKQLQDWQNGMTIQNAMPNLTTDQREFIMTGSTKQEWEELFSGEE